VHKAKVDATGHLVVGDGVGPLTIDGTNSSRPALPAKPIVLSPNLLQGTSHLYGPVATAFGITSVTLQNNCNTEQSFLLEAVKSPGTTSGLQSFNVQAEQSVELTFPSPLVVTPPVGGTASLQAEGSAFCIYFSAVGIQS
jgi:hypothetical protein